LQDKSVLDCGAIQKNPKRCKNLTESRSERALKRCGRTSSTLASRGNVYFLMQRSPSSKVLSLALAACLALVTVETVSARPKKPPRRASRRAAGRSFRPADGSVTEPAAAAARACLALTSHRRSTAWATASPVACSPFTLNAGLGNNPTIAPSTCAPARTLTGMNRLQRAHERECGGPRAPPRA
jgi:hypothetical protein